MIKHHARLQTLVVVTFLFSLVLLGATACSKKDDKETDKPIYNEVTEGTLATDAEIPVPNSDDILLTVTGKVTNFNQGDKIVMDLKTIEALGEVEYTQQDPFTEETITYRGVLMGKLLDLWGVPADAETLVVSALNDYVAEVPVEDLRKYPVIFALRSNGEYMPVSTRGPAMLVYPYKDFNFDHNIYDSYWVWQIKSIEVK